MNRPSLSNLKLEVARADLTYVAVFVDLFKAGVITQEKAEEITGLKLDNLPDSSFAKKYAATKAPVEPKKAAAPKKAPAPAPEKEKEED